MSYVELPINPPEPREVAECAWCGGEIYEGDEVAVVIGSFGSRTEYIHADNECKAEYAYSVAYELVGVIDRYKNIE